MLITMVALVYGLGNYQVSHSEDSRLLLKGLIETARQTERTVYLEYEGSMVYPNGAPKIADADGVYDNFTGAITARNDNAIKLDIYHRYANNFNLLTREIVCILNGKSEHLVRMADQRGGDAEIRASHHTQLNIIGSFTRIYNRNQLASLLDDKAWEFELSKDEILNETRCLVATFRLVKDPKLTWKFWIDPARGMHTVRTESWYGNDLGITMTEIELEQFKDDKGLTVWLPTKGKFEAFGSDVQNGKLVYGKTPSNRETFRVLPESVQINREIANNRFAIKYPRGTQVTDKMKRIQFEYGQTPPRDKGLISKRDVQDALDEQLKQATSQETDLKAASWERSRSGLWEWIPAILASMTLTLLCIYGVRNRRRR